MRRSRTLTLFGVLVTVLAVGTVSPRSHASSHPLAPSPVESTESAASYALDLLPAHGVGETTLLERTVFPSPGVAIPSSDPTPTGEPTTREAPGSEACPPETVEVSGDYCPVVEQRCLRWLDPISRLRCAEFEPPPAGTRCGAKSQHHHFCIDWYEWPNRAGSLPAYMASFRDAKSACESVGKRLCDDTEWTLACEGPERQPYPYGNGFTRDDRACNIDKPYVWPRPEKVFDPKTQADEFARLDQREPSGSRATCVSPYGVHDMVGNVDEWVVNASQSGKPFVSGLKGGYWGPVRTRCRPMTTAHDETFRYYQIGFRCCSGAMAPDNAPVAAR